MRSRGKPAKFIGVDGEAVTDDQGHRYVMLCASTGDYTENSDGLSTVDCFEFLLNLKRHYPDRTLVGFGFNYDVNMMLVDIHKDSLIYLWKDREASLVTDNHMYEVKWIPTKFIEIRSEVSVSVSDVFGFFQTSFLKALKDWNVDDHDNALERIESGKADRAIFQVANMKEMRRYCITECQMLVELCNKLQDSLREAGLKVASWIGAGAVGQAMLKKYDVLSHHVHDYQYPPDLQTAIMYAYFGGRFEMYRQGYFERCYNYDIISAYPYECLNLPSLIGGWDKAAKYDPDANYALWLVSWDLPDKTLVMPFPYRYKGNIHYPSEGKGWYWANEVRAAMKLHPQIKVLGGYIYHPLMQDKPFAFLTEVWQKRKEAKEQGLASQKAYKLGMNSLYGKLAQGKGYQGQVPKQRSFVWAGMICSNTRARLLEMMYGQTDNIIAVATDGLFFAADPGYDTGNDLGQLELNVVDDFWQLLNGIYYSPNAKIRTRGHSPKELDWSHITALWDDYKFEATYNYSARRFIGLGQALLRKDFGLWRTWLESERQIHLHQHLRKWLNDEAYDQFESNLFTDDNYAWYPGTLDGIKLGEVYKPKTDVTSIQTSADRQAVLDYLEMMEQPDVMVEG